MSSTRKTRSSDDEENKENDEEEEDEEEEDSDPFSDMYDAAGSYHAEDQNDEVLDTREEKEEPRPKSAAKAKPKAAGGRNMGPSLQALMGDRHVVARGPPMFRGENDNWDSSLLPGDTVLEVGLTPPGAGWDVTWVRNCQGVDPPGDEIQIIFNLPSMQRMRGMMRVRFRITDDFS